MKGIVKNEKGNRCSTACSRQAASELLVFIGEAVVAFLKLPAGKASFRRSDLMVLIQECGVDALPIVTLISFLVGLILAFVGAVQLEMFGALQEHPCDIQSIGQLGSQSPASK